MEIQISRTSPQIERRQKFCSCFEPKKSPFGKYQECLHFPKKKTFVLELFEGSRDGKAAASCRKSENLRKAYEPFVSLTHAFNLSKYLISHFSPRDELLILHSLFTNFRAVDGHRCFMNGEMFPQHELFKYLK